MPYKTSHDTNVEIIPDKPKLYAVIMHNDDYTPMDFVVLVLLKIFKKSNEEATRMMMTVHKSGQCAVAVYSYDVALTKKMKADQMSDENSFPLKITLSEVIA